MAQDEVPGRLAALEREIRAACAGVATVSVTEMSGEFDAGRMVDIRPSARDALGFGWVELGRPVEAIVLQAGRHGGRWEFEATASDVEFIGNVARAVIAGRVAETFGPGRSRVAVTLPSGEVVSETGYDAPRGCLPVPGWLRRGRTVAYTTYRPTARASAPQVAVRLVPHGGWWWDSTHRAPGRVGPSSPILKAAVSRQPNPGRIRLTGHRRSGGRVDSSPPTRGTGQSTGVSRPESTS